MSITIAERYGRPAFRVLATSGFTSLPEVHELQINETHLALDAECFAPLRDQPLHMVFRIQR